MRGPILAKLAEMVTNLVLYKPNTEDLNLLKPQFRVNEELITGIKYLAWNSNQKKKSKGYREFYRNMGTLPIDLNMVKKG